MRRNNKVGRRATRGLVALATATVFCITIVYSKLLLANKLRPVPKRIVNTLDGVMDLMETGDYTLLDFSEENWLPSLIRTADAPIYRRLRHVTKNTTLIKYVATLKEQMDYIRTGKYVQVTTSFETAAMVHLAKYDGKRETKHCRLIASFPERLNERPFSLICRRDVPTTAHRLLNAAIKSSFWRLRRIGDKYHFEYRTESERCEQLRMRAANEKHAVDLTQWSGYVLFLVIGCACALCIWLCEIAYRHHQDGRDKSATRARPSRSGVWHDWHESDQRSSVLRARRRATV